MRSNYTIQTNLLSMAILDNIIEEIEDFNERQKSMLNYDMVQRALELKATVTKMKKSIQLWLDDPHLESFPPVR